jgi:hypothetical protein
MEESVFLLVVREILSEIKNSYDFNLCKVIFFVWLKGTIL